MTIQQSFTQNILLSKNASTVLRKNNFELYVAQFGKERAEGYKEAIQDVLFELDNSFDRGNYTTPSQVKKATMSFLKNIHSLLDIANEEQNTTESIPEKLTI